MTITSSIDDRNSNRRGWGSSIASIPFLTFHPNLGALEKPLDIHQSQLLWHFAMVCSIIADQCKVIETAKSCTWDQRQDWSIAMAYGRRGRSTTWHNRPRRVTSFSALTRPRRWWWLSGRDRGEARPHLHQRVSCRVCQQLQASLRLHHRGPHLGWADWPCGEKHKNTSSTSSGWSLV